MTGFMLKLLAGCIILAMTVSWFKDQQPVFKAADDVQLLNYRFYKMEKQTPWLPKLHWQDEAARYLAPFLLVLLIFAARGKRDEYE